MSKLIDTRAKAQKRRAMKLLLGGKAYKTWGVKPWEIKICTAVRTIAIFDLRDCYDLDRQKAGRKKKI